MGQEANCVLRRGAAAHSGKALLESAELIFRAPSLRLKIPFSKMKSITAVDGELRFETPEGTIGIELAEMAPKWREKILHPKSRIEKLGVKRGARIELRGRFEEDFLKELKNAAHPNAATPAKAQADWVFLAVEARADLGKVASAAKKLRDGAGLWIVYPKGKKAVTEMEVISVGRRAGLKDVKVIGFSATHTALKFVIPLEKRSLETTSL